MNEKRTIPKEIFWQNELLQTWKLYHIEDDPQDYPLQWDGSRDRERGRGN